MDLRCSVITLKPASIKTFDAFPRFPVDGEIGNPGYNGYWYWGRPSIEDLRRDLREMLQKIRPDWDISDPELRAAWERGERDRFFPYGKSQRAVVAEKQ